MDQAWESERTGVFDTHPTDRDRMARARQEGAPGVYRLEAPSAQLLENFDVLTKGVTLAYYRRVLGEELDVARLVPGQEIVERHRMLEESRHARNRYFQGLLHPWRPWRPAPSWEQVPPPPPAPPKVLDRLATMREALVAAAPGAREKVRLYVKTETMLSDARQAQVLLDAGLDVDLTVLPLPAEGRRGIQAFRRQAEAWMADTDHELGELDDRIVQRLHIGLGLLRFDQVAVRVKDAPRLIRHASANLDGLRAWHDARGPLMELHDRLAHLWALLSRQDEPSQRPASAERITRTVDELHEKLARVRALLRDVPYPLEHSREALSIADFALGPTVPRTNPQAVAAAAESALDNLMELYCRMMGRLALIAEHVEGACGLQPLKQPDDEELW